MIIAGIDPSLTSTGVAILRDGKPILLRPIIDKAPAKTYDARANRINRQLTAIGELVMKWPQENLGRDVDLVVIEGEAYGINMPGTSERNGLWWDLYRSLRLHRLRVGIVNPTTRAFWATGDGKAKKPVIVSTVREWWPYARDRFTTDDIADAAVLALAGAFHLGDPMPFRVKPQHVERLKAAYMPIPGVKREFEPAGGLW